MFSALAYVPLAVGRTFLVAQVLLQNGFRPWIYHAHELGHLAAEYGHYHQCGDEKNYGYYDYAQRQ